MTHRETQRSAIASLTFHQWFNGRATYLREHPSIGADAGEQAMRADYVADKAWWYRTYESHTYPTFGDAAEVAQQELPSPTEKPQVAPRTMLSRLDAAIAAAARSVPSDQWSNTLIPQHVLDEVWGEK